MSTSPLRGATDTSRRAVLRMLPAAAGAIGWWGASPSALAAERQVRLITFAGGANLPLWVAEEQRFFAREQLVVRVSFTPNSVALVKALLDGEQEMAWAAFDNVVAYQEGQGEVTLPVIPDLFAYMGVSRGNVRLVVTSDVKSYQDLRGKTLGVDAVSTGFAFALRKLLRVGGLRDDEVILESIGGTAARAQALMDGKIAGTILTTPLEIGPEARGFRRLANVTDALGPYQAGVGVARRSWAAANRPTLEGFIRASVAAINWLYDPRNREEAVAIYRKYMPAVPPAAAQLHVNAMLADREGFVRDGIFDRQALETVLRIRSELAMPQKSLDDASRYIDDSYRAAALAR